MSVKNYGLYETGQRKMTLEMLEKIAKVLNVRPDYIFSFDENLVLNNNFFHQQGGNGVMINQANGEGNIYERYIEDLKKINTLLINQNETLLKENEDLKKEVQEIKYTSLK